MYMYFSLLKLINVKIFGKIIRTMYFKLVTVLWCHRQLSVVMLGFPSYCCSLLYIQKGMSLSFWEIGGGGVMNITHYNDICLSKYMYTK